MSRFGKVTVPNVECFPNSDFSWGANCLICEMWFFCLVLLHFLSLQPGDFVHTIGDAHVYLNHIEPLKIQLQREPRPFPSLFIKRTVTDIDDFKMEDFELVDYKPHPKIAMDMAVWNVLN
jgi:thymidylate synthase